MTEAPRATFDLERVLAAALILVLVSAVWVETDAYRYAAGLLFAYGAYRYWTTDEKPRVGWMGALCVLWSLYVAIRYATQSLLFPDEHMGTSEGVYLFPALYATVGYALWLQRRAVGRCARYFIFISLAMAAATVQIVPAGNADIYDFLHTDNTIHSSVCGGLIIFAALNFAAYAWRHDAPGLGKTLYLASAYLAAILCAIGIYWARSRGVWVAVGVAIVAQIAVSVPRRHDWRTVATGAAFLVALFAFIIFAQADLWSKIGPSFEAARTIAAQAYRTGDGLEAIRTAIGSGSVPDNMNERLMLWSNALEAWSHNVAFGNGIGWEAIFLKGSYGDVGFNLLHNGYLEIAVRYGVLGLAFYGLLYAWSIVQSFKAYRAGLIAREAFAFHLVSLVFFLATILTNSNNRLAIGESYMLVAAAFGFFCNFRLQQLRRTDPAVSHSMSEA